MIAIRSPLSPYTIYDHADLLCSVPTLCPRVMKLFSGTSANRQLHVCITYRTVGLCEILTRLQSQLRPNRKVRLEPCRIISMSDTAPPSIDGNVSDRFWILTALPSFENFGGKNNKSGQNRFSMTFSVVCSGPIRTFYFYDRIQNMTGTHNIQLCTT